MLPGHLRTLGTLQTPSTALPVFSSPGCQSPPALPAAAFASGESTRRRKADWSYRCISTRRAAELNVRSHLTQHGRGRRGAPAHPSLGWAPLRVRAVGLAARHPPSPGSGEGETASSGVLLPRLAGTIPATAPETFLLWFPWKRGIFFSPKLNWLWAGSGQGQAAGDACSHLPKLSP